MANSTNISPIERHHEVDWLRIWATVLVFLFHNARFYDFADWHVKSGDRSIIAMVFVYFVAQWIMPLFFLLAGASSSFAIERQSNAGYVTERFKRLIIPFIFGAMVLIPPQRYLEALTHPAMHFIGSFWQYYPEHFVFQISDFGFNMGWLFGGFGYHLWFLGFLFTYSLVSLPLFRFFRGDRGQKMVSCLGGWLERPGVVLWVGILPITLIQVALRAKYPSYLELADIFYWLAFFILGYLIYSDERMTGAVIRHRGIALALGVACVITMSILFSNGPLRGWEDHPSYSLGYLLYQGLRSINTWSWLIAILGFGLLSRRFAKPAPKAIHEIILPFYIFHQTVILIIGFYLVNRELPIVLKYLAVSLIAFGMTIGLCGLAKSNNITRFLLGMRPKSKNGNQAVGVEKSA